MSDSVRPHRGQATRLPHPWDSPGRNTGVGYHFLLQCMREKSESEVAQLCPTLSNSIDCSLPSSSVHGIFQARVLEWCAIAFSTFYSNSFLKTISLENSIYFQGFKCHRNEANCSLFLFSFNLTIEHQFQYYQMI